MSETPKRRRGDRRDAVLLRETDALHFIMGIIYPHRADNEAYIAERIDLEPIKAYLAKKNVEGIEFKYTFFHVIVAALVKTITLRPKLNRFYANENYYQRNKVTAGFIIKKEFSGGSEALTLAYQTVSTVTDPFASQQTLFEQLMEHQKRHERAELDSGQCLSGPHKDDFETAIGGRSVKSYGSQGQTRTASISLKLAERELMRRDTGEEPLLLLDDVLSELDAKRQDFVLNQIRSGQVLITCCETDRLTELGKVMLIRGGALV